MKIEQIKTLRLKPGDYVIAKVKGTLSEHAYLRLKEHLEKVFEKEIKEKNVRVLVVDGDLEISKLRILKTGR